MTVASAVSEVLERTGSLRESFHVPADGLVAAAGTLLADGYRLALVAAVDSPGPLRVVYLFTSGPPDRRVELVVDVDRRRPEVPSLAELVVPRQSLRA